MVTPAGKGQNEFCFTFIEAQINTRNSFLVYKHETEPLWAVPVLPGFRHRALANIPHCCLSQASACPLKCMFALGDGYQGVQEGC